MNYFLVFFFFSEIQFSVCLIMLENEFFLKKLNSDINFYLLTPLSA
jgi:hypothetical protein